MFLKIKLCYLFIDNFMHVNNYMNLISASHSPQELLPPTPSKHSQHITLTPLSPIHFLVVSNNPLSPFSVACWNVHCSHWLGLSQLSSWLDCHAICQRRYLFHGTPLSSCPPRFPPLFFCNQRRYLFHSTSPVPCPPVLHAFHPSPVTI